MPRYIILFRHGKSDWNANYASDHERPVSKRGIKAAKKMGRYLSNIDQVPGLTISSTALRARNTAELAINAGKWSSDLVLEKKIYESSVET
jgi:Phosphohistidine phosphatase SixA